MILNFFVILFGVVYFVLGISLFYINTALVWPIWVSYILGWFVYLLLLKTIFIDHKTNENNIEMDYTKDEL